MMGYEQLGYGQQPFQPQGFVGGPLGGMGSGMSGGMSGGGIGNLYGGVQPGGPLPFGDVGGGIQGQQTTAPFLQQHPVLQAVLQHPILAQQFLQSHPVLQAALQDPQTAAQLVQQHPLLQQALQHPLLARQIMQQHPLLHHILQQRMLQQMQQYQQQPQGWFGNQGGQYGQPGQMQPFGADPYSAWQQQAMAAQYRGMQQFQPGQLMGPGYQGYPGAGQAGGQTLH